MFNFPYFKFHPENAHYIRNTQFDRKQNAERRKRHLLMYSFITKNKTKESLAFLYVQILATNLDWEDTANKGIVV